MNAEDVALSLSAAAQEEAARLGVSDAVGTSSRAFDGVVFLSIQVDAGKLP